MVHDMSIPCGLEMLQEKAWQDVGCSVRNPVHEGTNGLNASRALCLSVWVTYNGQGHCYLGRCMLHLCAGCGDPPTFRETTMQDVPPTPIPPAGPCS